ncbi:MAG: hypothetical protein L3J52_06385 [Proteobacteria bacterium]|nr:hypothetical protein [Pseudomonadota bacterium]
MNQVKTQDNQEEIEKTKHVRNIARAISKLNLKFNVPIREFVKVYREELLKEARRQNPAQTTVEVALATGITRQKIAKIESTLEKEIISTREVVVMSRFADYCKDNSTNTIALNRNISSFKNIVDVLFKGQESYMAMAHDLVKKGCVEINNNEVKLISKKVIYADDPNKFLLVAGREMNSFVDCIIDNFKSGSSGVKKLQSSWCSDQIPPSAFYEVKTDLEAELKDVERALDKILMKHEDNNRQANHQRYPSGVFPRIGIQINFIGPKFNF